MAQSTSWHISTYQPELVIVRMLSLWRRIHYIIQHQKIIEIIYHFVKECVIKKRHVSKIPILSNTFDAMTKSFPISQFQFLHSNGLEVNSNIDELSHLHCICPLQGNVELQDVC